MISRLKPWLVLAIIAIAVALTIFGIDLYRHRFVRSEADLLALLPRDNKAVFFANVKALHRTGLLVLLAGSKPVSDGEYRDFVRETHFRYDQDLYELAGAVNQRGTFFVLRGRFDWRELRDYTSRRGGSCNSRECRLPASRAGQWASFFAIQPDVMALAVGSNASAVEALQPLQRRYEKQIPEDPIWVSISGSVLRNPERFPEGVRIFAIALQPAHSFVLSAALPRGRGAALDLKLYATCSSGAAAETIRNQLEIQTKMMRIELMREGRKPNPSDLTGLLTSGSFQTINEQVVGVWPVRTELLKTLE